MSLSASNAHQTDPASVEGRLVCRITMNGDFVIPRPAGDRAGTIHMQPQFE
jgi:hypothetical protein